MTLTEKKTNDNLESVLMDIDNILQSVKQEDIHAFADVIGKEIGGQKLDAEEIEQLCAMMNVDAIAAMKWKKVADVLKWLDIYALAEDNPEAVKKSAEVLLSFLGYFFPAAKVASGVLTRVSDQLFPILIKMGGIAAPENWIYRGVNRIANQRLAKAKARAESDAIIYDNMDTVIIVCKNKRLGAEMAKLIRTEDDVDEEIIVGTKDGTVQPVIWNEAAWEAYHDQLNENDKVLIIGKIKKTEGLTEEQIRFDQFGVKFGWKKNVAMIEADSKCLSKTNNYSEFLSAINALQITEKVKKNAKFKFDWVATGKIVFFPPLLLGDILRKDKAVKEQQLVFGLYHFYMQGLAEFLNQKKPE